MVQYDTRSPTLDLAFEVCPSAMLLVAEDGTIAKANERAAQLFGYADGELLGRSIDVLLPPSVRDRHPHFLAGYFAAPEVRAMGAGRDLTGVRRDGTEVPIEIGLNPVTTPAGRFAIAFVIDIRHRKELESSLRLAERHQRQIVEGAPNAMIMVDTRGDIVSVNAQAEALFGYRRDELLRRSIEVLVPERFRSRHGGERASYAASPVPRPMGAGRDLYGLRADGTEVPIEIGLNPLETPEGTFVLAAIIDITDRKRHESVLRTSLAQKETLLREIHHRVKNNMQVVSSVLSLQAAKIPTPEHRAMLLECQRRVRTMALIHEKLYGGGTAKIDCGAYVRDLAQMAFSTYSSARVPIELEFEVDNTVLDAQTAIPVGLIVHELVTNAMKHAFAGGRGGHLRIAFRRTDDGHACLTVGDDGAGMPATTTVPRDGGLGLGMVNSLARQIDGTVTHENTPGATFHVRFRLP